MYLDRNQALEKAFKEETEKTKEPQKDLVLTACEKLAEAVKTYQAGIKSGYGRKTKDNKYWKGIVSRILGVSRLYPARWNEVCEKVQQLGWLEIVVQEESGREYWNVPEEELNPLEAFLGGDLESSPRDTQEEIISTLATPKTALEKIAQEKAEKEGSYIIEGSCPLCGSKACEMYPNSRGLFRCNGCNDLHEDESRDKFFNIFQQKVSEVDPLVRISD